MNRQGLIVARHRREAVIETADGSLTSALVRGRKLKPVTGDAVSWRTEGDGTAVIQSILPRRTLLERIDSRGRAEAVAANVSLLLVIVASRPPPDWTLVDRYLVAAELLEIDAAVIRNKSDEGDELIDRRSAGYRRIGYPVIHTSARTGFGLDELSALLKGQRAVLLGQSGVGKSSILNALLESDAQAVGDLSQRRDLGRHTTTAAVLYRLPNGGELIDSPGVRRYSPNIRDPAWLAWGFREFRPLFGDCRFNDCRHQYEPGCALRSAVERGQIEAGRFRSYLSLRAMLESLQVN